MPLANGAGPAVASAQQGADQGVELVAQRRIEIEAEQWAQLRALQVLWQVETVQSRIGGQIDCSQVSHPVAHHALGHDTGRVGQQGARIFAQEFLEQPQGRSMPVFPSKSTEYSKSETRLSRHLLLRD